MQRYFQTPFKLIKIGDEQVTDLTTGNIDPIAGAGAGIDLHWNADRTAIVGSGTIPGINSTFSAYETLASGGNIQLKQFTVDGQTWTMIWKKM